MPQPRDVPMRFVDAFALAVWCGLVAGLCESVVLGILKFGFHRLIWLGPQVLWLAPLADAALLVVAAVVATAAARLWPRRVTFGAIVGALAFAATWGILLLIPGLHQLATLVLAAGIGVQAGRVVGRREVKFRRLVRRSLPGLVAVIAALGLGLNGWKLLAERRALAALTGTQPGAPNVLLIVLDTERAFSLSLYGYERTTSPNLAAFARGGTVFDQAIATSPWTLPSHAGMFTGLYAHQLRADWRVPLEGGPPTLAERLRARGYVTAGFVANLLYCNAELGLSRGFIHYEDYRASPVEVLLSSSLGRRLGNSRLVRHVLGYHDVLARKPAGMITDDFLAWLRRRPPHPFFAFLNYWDAHEPYQPPKPFDGMFAAHPSRDYSRVAYGLRTGILWSWERRRLSPAAREGERDAYDGSLAYVDREMGRVLDTLARRGLLDSTIVIVTSDHGEQFGEHDQFLHGNSLYAQLLRVPLVLRFPPKVPVGLRLSGAVTLRDLPATVLDLAGLPAADSLPGRSLRWAWWRGRGAVPPPSPALASFRPLQGVGQGFSLVAGGFHYIRTSDGRELLFDLREGPAEEHDLAASPAHAAELAALRLSTDSVVAAHPVVQQFPHLPSRPQGSGYLEPSTTSQGPQ